MSVLFAVVLFSVLILVHELGHFLTAKLFGVRVNEFSVFMGPALWQKTIGQTQYSLRCIPLGGYCALEGEDGDSEDPHSFLAAAWWKRVIILAAGALVNFLAGLILIACVSGTSRYYVVPVVDVVEEGCAFSGENGILEGDRILEIDGERICHMSDFSLIMSLRDGDVHELTVLRQGKRINLGSLNMERREFPNEDGTVSLRYGISFTIVESTPLRWLTDVWNTARDYVRIVRLSLRMLFRGQAGIRDVSGPVGIVKAMSQVAEASQTSWYAFLNLLDMGGLIAINLAVMNMLPLPALDGGRVLGVLLTAAAEKILRRKIDPQVEGTIHMVGMVLLMGLMLLIMCKDVFFLFLP